MRNSRKNRARISEDAETRKLLYIAGGVLVFALVAFVATFLIYTNSFGGDTADKMQTITKVGETSGNEDNTKVSTSIGKSINEIVQETQNIQNSQNQDNTTTEPIKIAINTSNMEKESSNDNATTASANVTSGENAKANETNSEKDNNKQETETKKEEVIPDPTFIKPVEGELTNEFAQETLIYSDTLQEWVTHLGVDIKAEKATVVKASADGTVKTIKNDPRYGITVVIEHVNGYQTIYSNLLTAEYVKEAEKITAGQTIGTVGNTATFEIAEDPHLHFEILKDGEYINPTLKISF